MKTLRKISCRLQKIRIPWGLSYPHGKLYGSTVYDYRHNPEMETVEFFKKHIKPHHIVADVGANIGYYTALFSSLARAVDAFEPSKSARQYLKKLERQKRNVLVFHYAIGERQENRILYSRHGADGMASMTYKAGKIQEKIEVLPLRHFGRFDWVKIDVEGAELEVLKGMDKTNTVLEVAKGIVEKQHGSIENFFRKIEELGYTIHFIVKNGETVEWNGENMGVLMNNVYVRPNSQ